MKLFAFALGSAFGLLATAHADPITAMSCVSPPTNTFAVVGIKTGLFAPSTQQILQYDVRLGKFGHSGEVKTEERYELESNMKIFDTAASAYDWVKANTVVIPLDRTRHVSGAVLVNLAKKQVTVIDTDHETIETLDCLVN